MGLLKRNPCPERACGWPLGWAEVGRQSWGVPRPPSLPRVQLAAGLHVRCFLCVECCSRVVIECSLFPLCHSFLSLPPFVFTQISFFASLLLSLLRQAGCPISLSSALACPPAALGLSFSTCPRPSTHCAFYCTEALRFSVK